MVRLHYVVSCSQASARLCSSSETKDGKGVPMTFVRVTVEPRSKKHKVAKRDILLSNLIKQAERYCAVEVYHFTHLFLS